MPAKVDKLTLGDRSLKRSAKLLECQVERIKSLHGEMSIGAISRMFNVSKRTVQFIIFPERRLHNVALRKKRGQKKYYNKEKHAESMRKHREHKKILL